MLAVPQRSQDIDGSGYRDRLCRGAEAGEGAPFETVPAGGVRGGSDADTCRSTGGSEFLSRCLDTERDEGD